MKLQKKLLIGVTALGAFALVACGGDAKEYTVTVEENGATEIADPKVKDAAGLIAALGAPTRTGYDFKGWFTDEDCTKPLTATTKLTKEFVVYAKWDIQKFTVKFNTNGGTAVADKTINYDAVIPAAVTTQDGYIFDGWYTDSAFTAANKFTINSTKVKSALTLYAKWVADAIEISTADEFIEYISSTSFVKNAILKNDIDMTGKTITQSTVGFDKVLDGAGHSIKNLTSTTGIFLKLTDGAVVKNIVFEDTIFTAAANNDSIISNNIDANNTVEISGITFKGLTFNSTGKQYNGILVGKLVGTLNLSNIAVVGSNTQKGLASITTGSYGGLVAQIAANSGATASGTLNASNVMIAANFEGVSGAQGVGGVVGQIHTGCLTASTSVSVDGFVFAGTFDSGKNLGAVIGDSNNTSVAVSIKNAIISIELFAKDTATSGYGIVIGQIKNAATTTYQNVQIVNSSKATRIDVEGNLVAKGATGSLSADAANPTGITSVASENVTMPNSNFAFDADLVITFNGVTAVLPESIKTAEVAKGVIEAQGATVAAQTATVAGQIDWITKTVSGTTATNAVKVKITKDSSVDSIDGGTYKAGSLATKSIPANGVIEFYLPVTTEMLGTNVEVVVTWNEGAIAQTYIVAIGSACTLEVAPAAGVLSTSDQDKQGLTASVDGTNASKINVEAGTIVYNKTAKGNFMIVEVARPSWSTSTTVAPTVTNGTPELNNDGSIVYITVKITEGDNAFTVNWEPTTNDANSYVIVIDSAVTIESDADAVLTNKTYTFNASMVADLTVTGAVAKTLVKDELTAMTGGKVDSKSVTYNSTSFTHSYNTQGTITYTSGVFTRALELKVEAGCTINVYFASGSSTGADRAVKVLKADGTALATGTVKTAATSADVTVLKDTITLTSAGTYYVGSSSSGIRIFSIEVVYPEA